MKAYAENFDEENFCPFTLEPFEDCSVSRKENNKICPFALEPCFKAATLTYK